jgi:hypothetical protein
MERNPGLTLTSAKGACHASLGQRPGFGRFPKIPGLKVRTKTPDEAVDFDKKMFLTQIHCAVTVQPRICN